jgi:hypothetical protein
MSGPLQITVRNNSGARRAYYLIVELTIEDVEIVYQNVYIAASPVPDKSGTANFFIDRHWFAVTGTVPGMPLGKGMRVCTSDFEIATLCPTEPSSKKGSSITMIAGEGGRGAEFDRQLLGETTEVPGGFSINVDNSFSLNNGCKFRMSSDLPTSKLILFKMNQFVGLGAADPFDQGSVIPVVTFQAQPGKKINIVPQYKYKIAYGDVVTGQVIDITQMPTTAEVDFSNKALSKCKVIHKDDGTWLIAYQ